MLTINIWSQQLTPAVIVNSGDYFENTNRSFSWSLGELAIETFSANSLILTQGFQQPLIKVTSIKDFHEEGITISVYPNPTTAFIHVEIKNQDGRNIIIEITDETGRILKNQP
jgi:hypothetical protein